MRSQNGWFKRAGLLVLLSLGSTGAFAFPEIPFCPLGGPPGWLNRIDDDDHHYYPPPYYPPPAMSPYWNSANPYTYYPQYQAYPIYQRR